MNKRYTIEEFRKFLKLHKNLANVYYYLNEQNLDEANKRNQEFTDNENFYL